MLIKLQPVFSILFADTSNEGATTATTVKKARAGEKPEDLLEKLLGDNHNENQRERLKQYLVKLGNEALFKNIFPGEDFNADAKEGSEIFQNKALDAFIQFEDRLQYLNVDCADREKCKASPEFKDYLNMAKTMDFVFTVIEGNPALQDMALEHAYKMRVLFPPKGQTFKTFDTCFSAAYNAPQNINLKQSHQPIHDLFLSALPSGIKHLDMWRVLISTNPDAMPAIIKNSGSFPGIEKLWEKEGSPKMKVNLFNNYLNRVTFERYDEAPALAAFLTKLRIRDERIFNRILDLVKQHKLHFEPGSKLQFAGKKDDKIPDISISAAELDQEDPTTAGYYWVKLPNGDPRGLILGHITGCCQLVTGHSEQCVIDGMNLSTSGFYVLLKVKKPGEFSAEKFKDPKWWENMEADAEIKAQSYVWRSVLGNLVMDSFEGFKAKSKDRLSVTAMLTLLKKFGEKLESEGIDRLSVGTGGGTPDFLKGKYSDFPEKMQEGTQYGDSLSQVITHESAGLIKAKSKLSAKFPNEKVNILASIQQVKLFAHLHPEQAEKLNEMPIDEFKIFVSVAYGYKDPNKFSGAVAKLLDLKSHNTEKYLALTSENALNVYQTGRVVVDDLITLDDPFKIKLLTSDGARKAYKHGLGTANTLKDLAIDQIQQLLSDQAIMAYETREVTVENLKDLLSDPDADKFDLLISSLAVEAFSRDLLGFKFKNLASKDVPTICATLFKMLKTDDHIKLSDIVIDPADFKGFDAECIKSLTSHEAVMAYKTGHVSPKDFKGLKADTIQKLLSAHALKAYKSGHVKAADLVNVDLNILPQLISDRAIAAYYTGKVSVTDLKDLLSDPDKFDLLISPLAVKAFSKDLLEFIFNDLASKNVLTIYATLFKMCETGDHIKMSDIVMDLADYFKGFDEKCIKLLTSHEMLAIFRTGLVLPADLRGLTIEVIRELTSSDALKVYKSNIGSVSDLKDLTVAEIRLLLTDKRVSNLYMMGISVKDLKELLHDNVKFELITSYLAQKAFLLGRRRPPGFKIKDLAAKDVPTICATLFEMLEIKASPADFVSADKEQIKALTSDQALSTFGTGRVTPAHLSGLNVDVIEALTSSQARTAYETGKISVEDLKDVNDVNLIRLLLSNNALDCYQPPRLITVAHLKDLTSDVIKKVISIHETTKDVLNYVSGADLKDLNIEVVGLLISYEALQAYKTDLITPKDLKDLPVDLIKQFISHPELTHYIKLADLKDLNIDVVRLLISDDALRAYKTREITFADLRGLKTEEIRHLVSYVACEDYKTHLITGNTLKGLLGDRGKLKLFTSHLIREALREALKQAPPDFDFNKLAKEDIVTISLKLLEMIKVKASPDDFAGADLKQILKLTDGQAVCCYQTGKVHVADFKDCCNDDNIYNAVTSKAALVCYEFGQATVADIKAYLNYSDKKKREALESGDAIKAFKTGKIKFTDLKDLNAADIRKILSSTKNIEEFAEKSTTHKGGFFDRRDQTEQSRTKEVESKDADEPKKRETP